MVIAFALWFCVVGGATIAMIRYSNAPGSSGAAPVAWPAESPIQPGINRPTLVMFAHPHCPCTRASLGELERFMAQFSKQVTAYVVFLKPSNTLSNWEKTDLWRTASKIPGVTIYADNAGLEARRFHSETSGQTLLYDSNGQLQFQGGITIERGHAGDNPGRSALEDLLREGHASQVRTPVFGCSLFESECEGAICKP